MSKPPPPPPPLSPPQRPLPPPLSATTITESLMTHSQLVDSLTSHISLYHSHSLPSSIPNNPHRSSILKWFSSLSLSHRQASLTIVDHTLTRLLLQMLRHLRTSCHGRFIILSDLPDDRGLPGLCFKKSRGLLSRSAEANLAERVIFDSVRVFGSREGEKAEECSCSVNCLDSITVSEELVESVDRFVGTMDEVSGGGFLRGEDSELGMDWVELEWLKARGYYSMEAFVANRLEVALRLAWMNCGNVKKRGVKLKEKVAVAGVAANVFWRKKGCVDWWQNLDGRTRKNFFNVVLGKAAKSLTYEVLKEATSAPEDERWLYKAGTEQPLRYDCNELRKSNIGELPTDAEFGLDIVQDSFSWKATSLISAFNTLFVLRDIVTSISPGWNIEKNEISELFFSTFSSVNTIRDCVLRKLRGLVMVISLDCTKLELFGEGNLKHLPCNSKEKPGAGTRSRKKAKTHNTKKLNIAPTAAVDCSSQQKPLKDLEKRLDCTKKKTELMEFNKMPTACINGDIRNEISSSTVEMEHSQGLVLGKQRTTGRKTRKGKNKNKNSASTNQVQDRESERSVAEAPYSTVLSSVEGGKFCKLSDNSEVQNEAVNGNLLVHDTLSVNTSFANEHSGVDQGIEEDHVVNGLVDQNLPEDVNCKLDCNISSHIVPTSELSTTFGSECIKQKETEAETDFVDKPVRMVDAREDFSRIQGQEKDNFYNAGPTSTSEYLSYEWPTLAPVYFPSINSHIPPATDRLHLDVGHNWHNHIRQPFVPTVHQARNSPIEGGCNRVFSQPLPMSLDWPPMVRSMCGFAPSLTCYDPGFISRRQSAFKQSFAAQNMQFSAKSTDEERKHSGDFMDMPEVTNGPELMDECENHWISEEEYEVHAVSGRDYNQYFGGGVMYWNPSDHPGTGFSRPPSLSSDDSSWAWREADMSRAVDDMVAFSSSYSTNGLTSPTAASFCSPFDTLGSGHQALGYVVSGNEVSAKVMHSSSTATDTAAEDEVAGSLASLSADIEGKAGELHAYPVLRPIIIPNMSRERSGSDFKHSHDHKSPRVPPTRREQPRIKRPPSPVVLCVPRAPRPPPPSPISESRKQRGFPTVRSGSSSPRHWGVRGWYHDGTNSEEACVRVDGSEVVWPSWRNKSLSNHPMIQPLPGALLQDRLIAISQLARDQEHPDVSFPLQPPETQNSPTRKASLSLMHSLLHDEIDFFCKQVAAANMARKPFINWAVKRVTRSLQVLWPRSRTNVFGSNATGLSLPTSDVDLVVCLPPVRNLEPIKEAGILEGRNGIKETCLQHAARYLANQEWVKNDSLKTVENTAIPIIMLVVEVPNDLISSSASSVQSPKESIHTTSEQDSHVQSDLVGSDDLISPKCSQTSSDSPKDVKSVRLDVSFKSPSHTGLQTTELVKELTEQFPAATPLALVLKQFLADRSLDQSYSGGLSSYCLVLLIIRFLQHEHHLGRPINQNLGSLLMDFLYFFGNVFDPRQMRISVQGSGLYINRERGCSIDPIHIDDPLFPTNNVGRNCFRIHQCIKAFSEAYSILENEITCLPDEEDNCSRPPYLLLPKIISTTFLLQGI